MSCCMGAGLVETTRAFLALLRDLQVCLVVLGSGHWGGMLGLNSGSSLAKLVPLTVVLSPGPQLAVS